MVQIKDTLVSDELFTRKFVCDLAKCKGICCVEGDSGAPVDENEKAEMERALPSVMPYMSEKGRRAVASQGAMDTRPVRPFSGHASCRGEGMRIPGHKCRQSFPMRVRTSLPRREDTLQKTGIVPSLPHPPVEYNVVHRAQLPPLGHLQRRLRIGRETRHPIVQIPARTACTPFRARLVRRTVPYRRRVPQTLQSLKNRKKNDILKLFPYPERLTFQITDIQTHYFKTKSEMTLKKTLFALTACALCIQAAAQNTNITARIKGMKKAIRPT